MREKQKFFKLLTTEGIIPLTKKVFWHVCLFALCKLTQTHSNYTYKQWDVIQTKETTY